MNPLSTLDEIQIEECRSPYDPESEEHCQSAPVYYSRPLDLVVANDLRDVPRKAGERGRAVSVRPWSQIIGITWHQTATKDFPPDHRGLINVPAHCMIHRDGSISLLHHPTAYVYHAHALNWGTLGVEVACRAAGVEGDRLTFWRSAKERNGWHSAAGETWPECVGYNGRHPGRWNPPRTYHDLVAEATDAQLAAIPLLMGYYCRLVGRMLDNLGCCTPSGLGARGQWAHRQGHASRVSDPGSRVALAVDRARLSLQLPDISGLKLNSGTPWPNEWLSTWDSGRKLHLHR